MTRAPHFISPVSSILHQAPTPLHGIGFKVEQASALLPFTRITNPQTEVARLKRAAPLHPIAREFRIESQGTETRQEQEDDMTEFNLESYLEHSKKVDASDVDFNRRRAIPFRKRKFAASPTWDGHPVARDCLLKGILSTGPIRHRQAPGPGLAGLTG